MTTDEMVAGLREAVEVNRRFDAASFYDADLWLRNHASAIADEMEALKRKADAFDLFMSCVDAVKDSEPSDVVNALLDKVKENARLRALLVEAIAPVLAEAKEREDYLSDTWNPDAHVELTLTIGEIRALHNLVKTRDAGEVGK